MDQNLPKSSLSPEQPKPDPVLVGDSAEQKKELRLLENLLELNLGLTFILGGVVIILVGILLIWRFSLLDRFSVDNKNLKADSQNTQAILPLPRIADSRSQPIFISQQIVELKKSLTSLPSKVKLTVNGQMKKEVFGFLPYWMSDRLDQIDTRLLTSISYFGLEVDGNGEIVTTDAPAWQVWQSDTRLANFLKTAKRNRIKVYLTLKAFNNDNIEKLVLSEAASQKFISTALYQLNAHSLDGINLDFEYVGTPDQKVIDGFSFLVSNLNKEMKRQYPKAVLTISTYVTAASTTQLHDIPILAQNSEGLVIMGYDFHTPKSAQAGPIAPMEGYGDSLQGMMSSYLEKAPAEKLILAVGYYGYDWPVIDNNKDGQVSAGSDVRIYTFADIIEATKNNKINWEENSKTPWYSYSDPKGGTRIVHFENARSLGIKYDYINAKNLQGVGIWALGFDIGNSELLQLLADKFAN